MALTGFDCMGTLTISGVSLNGPAWMAMNLERLWWQAAVRGEDRLMPGVPGMLPYRRRITETQHDLEFFVCGDCNQSATTFGDGLIGVQTNLDFLWANVFSPINSNPGTRVATLLMPNGASRSANVHVRFAEGVVRVMSGINCGQTRPAGMTGILSLTLPDGNFT